MPFEPQPAEKNNERELRRTPMRALFRVLDFTPFNILAVPQDTILHPDLKEQEETFFTNSKNVSLVIGVVVLLVLLEYSVGGGGKFVWVAIGILLVAFILPLRTWSEHLWRKYASWVYRTAKPSEAEAYFYMFNAEKHQQLLNIIYPDGFKETVSVRISRYDASKLLDQKKSVTVRRDYATGGAAIILDCQGRLYWCAP